MVRCSRDSDDVRDITGVKRRGRRRIGEDKTEIDHLNAAAVPRGGRRDQSRFRRAHRDRHVRGENGTEDGTVINTDACRAVDGDDDRLVRGSHLLIAQERNEPGERLTQRRPHPDPRQPIDPHTGGTGGVDRGLRTLGDEAAAGVDRGPESGLMDRTCGAEDVDSSSPAGKTRPRIQGVGTVVAAAGKDEDPGSGDEMPAVLQLPRYGRRNGGCGPLHERDSSVEEGLFRGYNVG